MAICRHQALEFGFIEVLRGVDEEFADWLRGKIGDIMILTAGV
jgi:hypothetical protein